MNLYILVEGEKTEMAFYPKWIEELLPNITRANHLNEVTENKYYLISGYGIPSINKHTINAIQEINNNPIFDYLIVIVDGEEIGTERRRQKLSAYVAESGAFLSNKCQLKIIVQNVCIESWFLGNRKIFKRTPETQTLKEYIQHYNVFEEDPELMEKINENFPNKANFHIAYLKAIFKEHKMTYSKANPKPVIDSTYIQQMQKRISETHHLNSYKDLFVLFEQIRTTMLQQENNL
ncbi:MAG: hypothetical protein JNM41_02255 [Flavipsychrobacter sp.]|nr:hypothetical protein [Flavipsychrobacter sp.]